MSLPSRASCPRTCCALLAGCILTLSTALHAFGATSAGVAGSLYPAPGTYTLHKIQHTGSGWVLEESAWYPRRFSSYVNGSITLFSFFYSTCNLAGGCPVAWSAFESVHQIVQEDPELKGRVRLVFLSLDPKVDTPDRLQIFAASRRETQKVAPWHFLTTWSDAYLKAILDTIGQDASRELDEEGRPTGEINHMIKVYLIDKDGWVREIYTTAFLDPEVIVNDIKTLIREEEKRDLPQSQ
jgi:protein SCO1/2